MQNTPHITLIQNRLNDFAPPNKLAVRAVEIISLNGSFSLTTGPNLKNQQGFPNFTVGYDPLNKMTTRVKTRTFYTASDSQRLFKIQNNYIIPVSKISM